MERLAPPQHRRPDPAACSAARWPARHRPRRTAQQPRTGTRGQGEEGRRWRRGAPRGVFEGDDGLLLLEVPHHHGPSRRAGAQDVLHLAVPSQVGDLRLRAACGQPGMRARSERRGGAGRAWKAAATCGRTGKCGQPVTSRQARRDKRRASGQPAACRAAAKSPRVADKRSGSASGHTSRCGCGSWNAAPPAPLFMAG